MACLLNTYAHISNINSILSLLKEEDSSNNSQNFLNPSGKGNLLTKIQRLIKKFIHQFFQADDLEWDDQIDNEIQSDELLKVDKKDNWLDSLIISISPCGNLLVIASKRHFVICQGKWSMDGHIIFTIGTQVDFNNTQT